MSETASILVSCPICKKIIIFDIEKEQISTSQKFPVPFVIEHCEKTLIAYVDAKFKVRGVQPVFNILEKKKVQVQENHIKAEPITPEFISNISSEEKEVLTSNLDCEALKEQKFPNVIEKQILMNIASHKEISIAILIKNLSHLEKAMNRSIDREMILKIVDKYIEKGLIKKQIVRFEENLSKIKDLKIPHGGEL